MDWFSPFSSEVKFHCGRRSKSRYAKRARHTFMCGDPCTAEHMEDYNESNIRYR